MDGKYIQVYENTLDPEFCQELIDMFELNSDLYDKVDKAAVAGEKTYFNQIHITEQAKWWPEWQPYHDKLVEVGRKIVSDYISILPSPVYPAEYTDTWENFRIKRYMPGGYEGFGLHGDATHVKTRTRWLAFFWYLNDVEEGGTTTFLYNEDEVIGSVEAKQGRCLVFPPLWTYPHKGDPPMSGPKYIVGSYLHIVGEEDGKI